MAKQVGPIFLVRTIGNLIFYKMDGKYYVRMKPSFPNIRRSPRFRGTMQSARRMGRASRIGAALYAELPGGLKQFDQYRVLTGAAFLLLKTGKTEEEALELLWAKQKDLVERGCAIAAAVYEGLAAHFKREWMLWAYAEEAMAMLEEGKPDEAVLAVLWKLYASEFEEGYREGGVFLHELPEVEEKAIKQKRDIERRRGMVVLADGRMVFMQAKPARKEGRMCNLRPENSPENSPESSSESSDVSPPYHAENSGAQERRRAGPGGIPHILPLGSK